MTALEIDCDLEGFFQDASEDFERLSEIEVASASRHVKLIKIKKVNTRPRRSKSKYSNKTIRSSSSRQSPKVEKSQKKVRIKYHLDSTEEVILDLDSKSKNLIEQFEDFVNNNHSDAPSPKTSPAAPKLKSCNPHDVNSSRKQFSSHSRPREWTKKESELQERMAW